MRSLINRFAALAEISGIGHATRPQKERARIRQDIPEHVGRHDHIKGQRIGDELINRVVDFQDRQVNAGFLAEFKSIVLPQLADGGNSPRLGRHAQLSATLAGGNTGAGQNSFNLGGAIAEPMMDHLVAFFIDGLIGFPEIKSSGIFAHSQNIDTLEHLWTNAACILQRRAGDKRREFAVQIESRS